MSPFEGPATEEEAAKGAGEADEDGEESARAPSLFCFQLAKSTPHAFSKLWKMSSFSGPIPETMQLLFGMTGTIAKNHANLRYNQEILIPLMVKMKDHRDKAPDVNALSEQVKKCFELSRLNPSATTLSDEAWSLRYMYGLVKQLTYKKKPPRDP